MEIGSQLNNRYTLTARVGQGSMGVVYRATDAQTGQAVALKAIARDLAFDSEMLQRFRREGEALHQLRHPNIVGFIEMFMHEGQNIIVMEYVPGGSLHELIRKGPLPPERARRIALEIGDALTRAHHIGIIHRDLKPENVLLTADGAPKLTDFGVARLISEGTRLTGTGAQVGTPYYMSPEAWEGKPLDAQADIWSLGVVFYEMLAGKLPFNGETVIAVMNKVLNAPLPDLRSLRPEAPPGLERIITRMLCREKADRYQTMREVAADIERGDIATPTPRPGPAAAPRTAPVPASAAQTRLGTPATRTAPAKPASRLRHLGWVLARLGLTAGIGLAVISCLIVIGGAVVLGNILEGVVASIPFYPNEIGPGETYILSREAVEAQLNQQTALALPGTLSNLRLTFVPSDTLRVNGKVYGASTTFTFRTEVAGRLPRVSLVSYNGLPLPVVGDLLAGGVNRGLAKIFTQNKLEMLSIVFGSEELTLVLNGPGVEKGASKCKSNTSFRDDFSTDSRAWNGFKTEQAKAYYDQGSYVLNAIDRKTILTQYLGNCSFGDVQITVDATNQRSSGYTEYGLMFNRKDAQNYYAFTVSTTGFYALQKVAGGVHEILSDGWKATPLLYTGMRVNHLGLRVEGIHVIPSINGQALFDYTVNVASYGDLGLYVGSADDTDMEVRFDNFAALRLAETTPFPTEAGRLEPTAQLRATVRATPATPTPNPLEQGLTLGRCNDREDLCIFDYRGKQTPLGLSSSYAQLKEAFSWSPDGQQIAFGACRATEMSRPKTCRDLYTIDRDGQNVVEVYRNTQTDVQALSWSPDGAWIALAENGQVVIIRPTGKDRQVLDGVTQAVRLAWSPNSQQVAWVGKSDDGQSTLVWMIDQSGKNRKLLFLDVNQPIQRDQVLITWSPDGRQVVYADEEGQAWSMAADCKASGSLGCDQTSRKQIKEVPLHWLPDFYPQWAGEKVSR
jgi:Tol biopolymer transport system component